MLLPPSEKGDGDLYPVARLLVCSTQKPILALILCAGTSLSLTSCRLSGSFNDIALEEGTSSTTTLTVPATPPGATALLWSQVSPYNSLSLNVTWTPSTSPLLSNQKVQFYSDSSCGTAAGSEVGFSPPVTSTSLTAAGDGTFTFKVTSVMSDGSSVASTCSPPMTIDTTAPGEPAALTRISPTTASTNDTTPTIRVTLPAAETNLSVALYTDFSCTASVASGTTNGTTIDLTPGPMSPATYTFYAMSTDAAGNTSPCSVSNVVYQIDTTAPTVTAVTSSAASGLYGPGLSIAIDISFSEAVTVDTGGGTPTLGLTSGGSATYASGSGTTTLRFNYTVSGSDISFDLDQASSTALSTGGGTLRDLAGNDATLTLAESGAPGSLGAAKAIEVDAGLAVSFNTNQVLSESVGTVTVTASIAQPTVAAITVPFTVSGSASNPADHNAANGSITINSGSTTGTTTFNVVNDAQDEAAESINFTMGTPTNAVAGSPSVHTVTLNDDDPTPNVYFSVASQSVAEGVPSVTLTAALSAVSGLPVTVPFTVGGSATSPADHNAAAGSITISAGSSTGTYTFGTAADPYGEPNETVVFTMGTPTNAVAGGGATTHTVTILNNEISSWPFVDNGGGNGANYNTAAIATFPALITFNTKLYAAWQEINAGNYQIRVKVYNGNDSSPGWSFVDGGAASGINKSPTRIAQRPRLAIHNSKLYITWYEANAGGYNQIRVAVYNGNDGAPAWTFVDGNAANGLNMSATQSALDPILVSHAGTLYLVWTEPNPTIGQIRAKSYNGNDGSPVWTSVDGGGSSGLNFDPVRAASNPKAVSFGSNLILTWKENNASSIGQIRTASFDGATWTLLDGGTGLNYSASAQAASPSLVVFNSKVYLFWTEVASSFMQLRAKVFNGNIGTPAWSSVDGGTSINFNTTLPAELPTAVVFNNKLYVGWGEGTSKLAWVKVYNGNDGAPAWATVNGGFSTGINKNSANTASHLSFDVLNNKLYCAWDEGSPTAQITIARGQ